jgi:hypothetical protein
VVLKNLIRLLFPVISPLSFDKGGSPPAAPPAPDPAVQIAAQAKADRYNVKSPFGTQTWTPPQATQPQLEWRDGQAYHDGRPVGNTPSGYGYMDVPGDWTADVNFQKVPGQSEGTWAQEITLDPSQQRQFEARNRIAEQMLGRASNQFGQLPTTPFAFNSKSVNPNDQQSQQLVQRLKSFSDTPFTPNLDGSSIRDAVYGKAKMLLDPTYGRMQEQLDQKLVNQGLPIGSEAYGQANDVFGRERSNAYETAALDAVMQGANEEQNQFGRQLSTRQQAINEILNALQGSQSQFGQDYSREYGANQDEMGRQLTARQQQYNELAALLGGQQLNPLTPSGGGLDANTAYANQQAGVNRQYQGQLAGYNAGVSQNNATIGGLFSLAAAAISDVRLKRDIERVGIYMPGVWIYEFSYIWGGARHIGVMAQEVLGVMPEAVFEREDGYLMVDYAALRHGRTVH